MQKLSGLVLDHYDDHDGSQLKGWYSTLAEVPDFIKQAHLLSSEEQNQLSDDSFALVMIDGDKVFRKYACIDEGNVVLSIDYFLNNGHKLPEEAQKVAAANLVTACVWYGLEPPEALEKVALGVGGLLMAGMIAPGVAREAKANLTAAKAGLGGQIVTPQDIETRRQQMGLGASKGMASMAGGF
jgi:hypothetical protein